MNQCERCKSHYKSIHAEDGWYCGRYLKWICRDSLTNDKKSYFVESKKKKGRGHERSA